MKNKIFILLVITLFILLLISFYTNTENLKNKTTTMYGDLTFIDSKIDCYNKNVYCFSDKECQNKCLTSDCVCFHGICSSHQNIIKNTVDNPCDGKKGVYGLLVGDPQLGNLNVICKSLDLGIAKNDGTNTMCTNGKITIDYNKKNPNFKDCICDNKLIRHVIPNTKMIRERAICTTESMQTFLDEATANI